LLAALSSDLAASHRALNEMRRRLRERRPDLLERWRRRTRGILAAEGEEDVDEEEEEEEGG
jgi:vacuolar-type H+-ATPase subunit E/Vma4